jgi:hypothetical protein
MRPPASLDGFLAGLQAGMVGVLWMLAWLGVSSVWLHRSFWTAADLLATVFGRDATLDGFSGATLSGLALYVLLYSSLGGVFALVATRRGAGRPPGPAVRPVRIALLAIVLGLAWYYLSFHWLWRNVAPLVAFLHPERSTVVGHVIYGAALGRFHAYLPRKARPEGQTAAAPEKIPDSLMPGN